MLSHNIGSSSTNTIADSNSKLSIRLSISQLFPCHTSIPL